MAGSVEPAAASYGSPTAAADLTTGPTIPASVLSHYALVAQAMGLDAQAMLNSVGILPEALAQPTARIPAIQVSKLIEVSAVNARAQDFGLRMALARGAPDIGPLSLLLREEPDLRSALRSLENYLPVHSRSLRIEFREIQDAGLLSTNFAGIAAPFSVNQATEMIVCSILQSVKWLVGGDWRPAAVSFAHAPASPIRHYYELLGCPVEFDQEFDGLVLAASDLTRPIATSSPQLRRHAEEYVQLLLSGSASDTETEVTRHLTALLAGGCCSATSLARRLGVDRSTLHRRLAAESLNYRLLMQKTRMTIAGRSCLSRRPLAELADQLGFSSLSVFSRWFSRSFGCSVRTWRQRERQRSTPKATAAGRQLGV